LERTRERGDEEEEKKEEDNQDKTRRGKEEEKFDARSNLIQGEHRTSLGGYNVLRNNLACNLIVVNELG
jgi:hypothetical protein